MYGTIEAQLIKVGMIAEATCVSKPLTIIPLMVTRVQDVIASWPTVRRLMHERWMGSNAVNCRTI